MFRSAVRRCRQPWRWLPFRLRLAVARVRQLCVRRRLPARAVILVVLGGVVLLVGSTVREGRAAVDRWGSTSTVLVAAEPIAVGTPAEATTLTWSSRPRAVVPVDALVEQPAAGDRYVAPLHPGEVVTERDLLSGRGRTISTPPGMRAIALPGGRVLPPVEPGDLVDIVVVGPLTSLRGGAPRSLAPPAIVLVVDDEALTVGITAELVPTVADALIDGSVTVALR